MTDSRQPTIEVGASSPTALPAQWWRNPRLAWWSLAVVIVSGAAVALCGLNGWSALSFTVAGLVLDCAGIALIASPFASRALLRIRYDARLRWLRGELDAHRLDSHAYESGLIELDRQRAAGVPAPRVQVPDIEPRNSMASDLAEELSSWERRLHVPDREAASFILAGTAFAIIGFGLQIVAQFAASA